LRGTKQSRSTTWIASGCAFAMTGRKVAMTCTRRGCNDGKNMLKLTLPGFEEA
jgi:hypothetical protein